MKPRKSSHKAQIFWAPKIHKRFSRKGAFIFAILLILFSGLVSAININIQETYQPGQTLIASIEGNFISPLTTEQIYFYEGRIQVPLIYDLGKIQDKYYLYALLPVKERNLTLVIKNAYYIENKVEHLEDIRKNFTIKGNLTDFSVNPGLIITRDNFEITVESMNNALKINADFLGNKQEVDVSAAQKKKISFSVEGIKNSTFTEITISSPLTTYKIPASVSPSGQVTFSEKKFRFNQQSFERTISTKSNWLFDVYLLNLGQEDINDIKIESNLGDILKIKPDEIKTLKSGTSEKIELTFKVDSEKEYEGEISAVSGNLSTKLSIKISAKKNESEVDQADNPVYESCSELKGIICNSNETCSGYTRPTSEGRCCVAGKCEVKKESSLSTIVWVIIVIIIIAAILFFVLTKMKPRKKTSSEVLKEKEEDYEGRFTETKGKLTKV